MNTKEIATALINRRETSTSSIIMQGDLQKSLGTDGFQEAMRRGWVIPDYDTGHMTITNNLGEVDHMRKMSEAEEPLKNGDSVVVNSIEPGNQVTAYPATVTSVGAGGKVRVTFNGATRPTAPKPEYEATEVKKVSATAATPTVPTTPPAPTTPVAQSSGPEAPGIGRANR